MHSSREMSSGRPLTTILYTKCKTQSLKRRKMRVGDAVVPKPRSEIILSKNLNFKDKNNKKLRKPSVTQIGKMLLKNSLIKAVQT